VLEVLSQGRLDEWGKTEHSTQRRTTIPSLLQEDLAQWRSTLQAIGPPSALSISSFPAISQAPSRTRRTSRTPSARKPAQRARHRQRSAPSRQDPQLARHAQTEETGGVAALRTRRTRGPRPVQITSALLRGLHASFVFVVTRLKIEVSAFESASRHPPDGAGRCERERPIISVVLLRDRPRGWRLGEPCGLELQSPVGQVAVCPMCWG
jgi:hypothetical protein